MPTKTRFSAPLGCDVPDYPPTYAGMIEQSRDEGTAEAYHYAATIIRRSRNLSRQGRANALRDLRDAMGRSGRACDGC